MRIGFDYRMGGSINAGIGRYCFELLNAMLDQNQSDEFVVFYNEKNVDQRDLELFASKGATLVPTAVRHYSFAEQLLLPKILQSHNLDLMHFPNFNVPLRYQGDYVVTLHDMVHHKISGHKKSRVWKFYAYRYIIEQAAKRAKKIITVTEYAKKEIIQYLQVPADKIEVIYLAPASHDVTPTAITDVKKKYLLSRPYILFVGAMERKKNIPTLAKGFDIFLSKYKYDMDLVIAGKIDPHYPEVKEQIMDITHRNRIVFTGYVTDADQIALYQGAYAFATASLHEGFGLPGVEAMKYGVPVLASNTEVFNEVYDNAAIYFDPLKPEDIAEHLHLLVSDTPFYQQMQQKVLDRSVLFDWGEAAEQTLQVYHTAHHQTFSPEDEA